MDSNSWDCAISASASASLMWGRSPSLNTMTDWWLRGVKRVRGCQESSELGVLKGGETPDADEGTDMGEKKQTEKTQPGCQCQQQAE